MIDILHGDSREVLRAMDADSIDAVVTDPPAGISFMARDWDHNMGGRNAWIAWLAEIMREALRVTKPGGHAFVWALPRTSHWTAIALEDAGWEVRDCVIHVFGSGFPKNHDISKAIDRMAGAEREVIGKRTDGRYAYEFSPAARRSGGIMGAPGNGDTPPHGIITAPATDAARQWAGWGSALKPSTEHWWLCRKPISENSIAANVLKHGTGALNIDAGRVGWQPSDLDPKQNRSITPRAGLSSHDYTGDDSFLEGEIGKKRVPFVERMSPAGRWPANLILTHAGACGAGRCAPDCPIAEMDRQSGASTAGQPREDRGSGGIWNAGNGVPVGPQYGDSGGASRYFHCLHWSDADLPALIYQSKASRGEREQDLLAMPRTNVNDGRETSIDNPYQRGDTLRRNTHPTIKPISLIKHLLTLITPPGGVVLDCFAGSGTTAVAAVELGINCVAIEREAEYVDLIRARVAGAEERMRLPLFESDAEEQTARHEQLTFIEEYHDDL